MRPLTRLLVALLLATTLGACSGGTVDDDPFQPNPPAGANPPAGNQQPGGAGNQQPGGAGNQQPGGAGNQQPGGAGNQQPGTVPNAGGATSDVPDWLRVGTRLTWYVAAASVAQSRFAWVEDPNGGWTNPRTGKKYSRTDEGGGTGQPGASGDGLSQVDVLAIEGSDVVLDSNIYTINRTTTPLSLGWVIGPGARVSGAAVDGAWIHPQMLRQYAERNTGDLLVLHGPYDVGGRTYAATAFATTTAGAYQSYTYDSESGILLSASTNTAGATSPFAAPGENPPVGNTQLTYTQFVGMRQRTLPGLGATAPSWVAGTAMLRYGGIYNITNPLDPGSGSFTYQAQYTVTLGRGGLTWAPYERRGIVEALGEQPVVTSVTGSSGLYWYDPASLAQMTPGQVLDQDPITGQQTVVSAAGSGAAGMENIVAIDMSMPGVFAHASYDRSSGTLVAYDLQLPPAGTTIRLQLQGG